MSGQVSFLTAGCICLRYKTLLVIKRHSMSMTNRARKTSKAKNPSESRGDDETWGWVCPGCNEPSIDIIKCDMCFKCACYSCQDVTTDITRTLEKLGNVGIKWHCVICRERGERDSQQVMPDKNIDSIL